VAIAEVWRCFSNGGCGAFIVSGPARSGFFLSAEGEEKRGLGRPPSGRSPPRAAILRPEGSIRLFRPANSTRMSTSLSSVNSPPDDRPEEGGPLHIVSSQDGRGPFRAALRSGRSYLPPKIRLPANFGKRAVIRCHLFRRAPFGDGVISADGALRPQTRDAAARAALSEVLLP